MTARPWQHLYNYRWTKARAAFLKSNPACVFCRKRGLLKPATVVDHKVPHKGDEQLFWQQSNWQPLCKPCHDSVKSSLDRSGRAQVAVGLDGWPIEIT